MAKHEGPNKSFLETCVLLWRIGDYFCLNDLAIYAIGRLDLRTGQIYYGAQHLSSIIKGIDILPDLEAGIRAAWRQDRVPCPGAQAFLTNACMAIYPYLRDVESFITLLDELPQFSTHLLKAILGCRGENNLEPGSIQHALFQRSTCRACKKDIPAFNLTEAPADIFYRPPTSCAVSTLGGVLFCSRVCQESTIPEYLRGLD